MTLKQSDSGAKPKRPSKRPPKADIRQKLLDATETVVRAEGYAAASVRRVAREAKVTHQAVFYYFGSQEELLLALLQRASQGYRDQLEHVLSSERPIRALWDLLTSKDATHLGLEFMALANHNASIQAEIARNAHEIRDLETQAIKLYLAELGIEPKIPPLMVSVLTNALARLLVQEASLGITSGHEEVEKIVEQSFAQFEASVLGDLPEIDALLEAISTDASLPSD
jgi:TetR/AcrR family transcriptional regulator of autoinduction and epiphytic fitness